VNNESQNDFDKSDEKIIESDAPDEELEKAADSITSTVPIPFTNTAVLPACTGC
jgi:hypothetical protein